MTLTPKFRATITAIADRDDAILRVKRELRYARRHREAGELGQAAACLECAADARDELAGLINGETR